MEVCIESFICWVFANHGYSLPKTIKSTRKMGFALLIFICWSFSAKRIVLDPNYKIETVQKPF